MGFLDGILYMLWRGIAIGIIISAPMGPVGILCIQRTLAKGRKTGFYTGVGAAASDLLYCLLTGFGLSFIEEFLEKNQNIIQIVGSVVLIAFALYLFISNPSKSLKKPGEKMTGSPKTDILNGFLFTVSNPLIIFLIIGLFARFNFLLPEILPGHYFIGFSCIILGALGWWWMVTFFVDKVRAHFNLRSMWLINKIIGGIIAIFGIVGIITAITGIAHAGKYDPAYYNSGRVFGTLATESDTVMMVNGNDAATFRRLDIGGGDFRLDFRARNLHNAAGRRYQAREDGVSFKVFHPQWSLVFADDADSETKISFRTIDDIREPLGPTALIMTVSRDNEEIASKAIKDKLDWFTGWNAFRIDHSGEIWRLYGGERDYNLLAEWRTPGYMPVEVRWECAPGALLDVDWIRLEHVGAVPASLRDKAVAGKLDSCLLHSDDPMEGVWEMYDRSLDDNALRYQGNYRFAILSDESGDYEIIYLDGATKNPASWQRGMLKGRLKKTSFSDVYDVEWTDADHHPVLTEIKAEFEEPDLISIQFPELSSSFRMRKTR